MHQTPRQRRGPVFRGGRASAVLALHKNPPKIVVPTAELGNSFEPSLAHEPLSLETSILTVHRKNAPYCALSVTGTKAASSNSQRTTGSDSFNICPAQREEVVSPPARCATHGPQPEQAKQTVVRAHLCLLESNRSASRTLPPNPQRVRKPTRPIMNGSGHSFLPFHQMLKV